MEKLNVLKIGGNVIDDPRNMEQFLQDFAAIEGYKILIHGGGKIASRISLDLGIEAKLVEGRRITDAESLKVVTMVYAGLVNKSIVAQLQAKDCNAIGLCGADGNLIKASKRPVKAIDYGFAGDLDNNSIAAGSLKKLLETGFIPVFSAITHDGNGQLLNTNADTIASAIAVALSPYYGTSLVYCFDKKGVLENIENEDSVIREIRSSDFESLKEKKIIADGMIPKLHNAFQSINNGVREVYIGKAAELSFLNKNLSFGTRLIQ
ncbi:acetylglutamate kinase [Daejeonella oryzae]|uniref:acetylglutamate kinase n=1 Tax=Daejeonella oryzae TaxID=1122943 RepID=UPI00040DE735|nr:acetylglutamate kinase [Daejeonella oryzae]